MGLYSVWESPPISRVKNEQVLGRKPGSIRGDAYKYKKDGLLIDVNQNSLFVALGEFGLKCRMFGLC